MNQTTQSILADLNAADDTDDVWRLDSGLIIIGDIDEDTAATWIGNVAEIRAEYQDLVDAR